MSESRNGSRAQGNVELGVFVLRLGLGAVMLAHGLTKVFVFTLPGTAAFFSSVGFPGFMAYPVTALEVIGGILLLVGYQSRWVGLALVPVMAGATTVHIGNGWSFTAAGGGWEFPAFLAVVALVQFLLATDGAWALSSWLRSDRTAEAKPELVAT